MHFMMDENLQRAKDNKSAADCVLGVSGSDPVWCGF